MYDARQGYSNPTPPQKPPARGSLLPVMTVAGFAMSLILILVAFTGVAGIFVVLVIGGLVGFIALHYVVWGWWLSKSLRDDPSDLDESPR